MVYYNPRYNIIAVCTGTFHTLGATLQLLEYNEDGNGVFVLTREWAVVGAL